MRASVLLKETIYSNSIVYRSSSGRSKNLTLEEITIGDVSKDELGWGIEPNLTSGKVLYKVFSLKISTQNFQQKKDKTLP